MRWNDYIRLAWDQLKRRKVVTAMCAIGIAIGSSSIMVALAFGESISYYSQQQFQMYTKTDEITVTGLPDFPVTDQKIGLIRSFPHVVSAAPFKNLGSFELEVDDGKKTHVEVIATELEALDAFGFEFDKGSGGNVPNGIVLSYGVTLDIQDEKKERLLGQLGKQESMDIRKRKYIPYPLYQKRIELKYMNPDPDKPAMTIPFQVTGILKKPEGMPDYSVAAQKTAYVSLEMGKRMEEWLARAQYNGNTASVKDYSQLIVKVDSTQNVQSTEALIQKLKLNTYTNLHWQEQMQNEFMIVRLIFAGAGLFILFVASISIIVAMTMSTYQRRRQIGIMKVLGANLRQIRNMFIFESALLGLLGGCLGVLISYWVIWGINIAVRKLAQADELLFISWWVLPVGLCFALLTGVLSGIYPAVKASRTDALSAIRRE